jgi:hypothetical protein
MLGTDHIKTTTINLLSITDNARELRQRHALARRVLPQGRHPPPTCHHAVDRPLHSLGRTTRNRRYNLISTLLLGGQQILAVDELLAYERHEIETHFRHFIARF